MLKKINQFMQKVKTIGFSRYSKKNKGQVAIVLLFITAIALIFYAVTLNLGTFSKYKTITTVASNTGASILASQMSSYGQYWFETQLGGELFSCGWTGVAGAILIFIVVVIAAVLAVFTVGSSLVVAAAIIGGLGVVMAGVAIGVQAAAINPAMTNIWDRIMEKTLTQEGAFLERGISAALQKAATDSALVPDFHDFDGDAIWEETASLPHADMIPRYSVYYSSRLGRVPPIDTEPIETFQKALAEFMYDDPFSTPDNNHWGLYDPVRSEVANANACPDATNPCCGAYPRPSMCNICCVPDTATEPTSGDIVNIKPLCCGDETCGSTTTCSDDLYSSYVSGSTQYPLIWDNAVENWSNTFVSFRESIGKDDEHGLYHRDFDHVDDPNYYEQIADATCAGYYSSMLSNPLPYDEGPTLTYMKNCFVVEDATSFWPDDPLPGVYPIFYKLADWGVELNKVNFTSTERPAECMWCDYTQDSSCAPDTIAGLGKGCNELYPAKASVYPAMVSQLKLASTMVEIGGTVGPLVVTRNSNAYVDRISTSGNVVSGGLPLSPDKVVMPLGIIETGEDASGNVEAHCSQDVFVLDNGDTSAWGVWQRGSDRYCSTAWPYYADCLIKHTKIETSTGRSGGVSSDTGTCVVSGTAQGCDCDQVAAATDKLQFNEDVLDDLVNGLPEFFVWAETILQQSPRSLARNFDDWYIPAADFIEPLSPPATPLSADFPCYVCSGRNPDGTLKTSPVHEGALHYWWREIQGIRNRFLAWRNETSYAGSDVWCVPPSPATGGGSDDSNGEEARFDFNGNGVRGDLEDVVACLDWNAHHSMVAVDALGNNFNVTGNAQKFLACRDICNEVNCSDLPRSLVPDFDPKVFDQGDHSDSQALDDCLAVAGGTSDAAIIACKYACNELAVPYDVYPSLPLDPWWDNPAVDEPETDFQPICSGTCAQGICSTAAGTSFRTAVFNARAVAFANDDLASWEAFDECYSMIGGTIQECMAECDPNSLPFELAAYNQFNEASWIEPTEAEILISPGTTCGDSAFVAALTTAKNKADGSCGEQALFDAGFSQAVWDTDLDGGVWQSQVAASYPEAINQVVKFDFRHKFLKERLDEADEIIALFDRAAHEFESFLRGPVSDLTRDFIAWMEADKDLPYHVIYGWKDVPDYDNGQTLATSRPWHLVRVDGRIPKKCDNACNEDQLPNGDPLWPSVQTFTHSWGTKRCYTIDNTVGVVKMRVVRWDQERDTAGLYFPNGELIWDFKFYHPGRVLSIPNKDIDNTIKAACSNMYYYDTFITGDDAVNVQNVFDEAFILNQRDEAAFRLGTTAGDTAVKCWNLTNDLLQAGISSETCAQYYFHDTAGSEGEGFTFKFVPCEDF